MNFNILEFENDIWKVYNEMKKNNTVRKSGIINHDILQENICQLANKYELEAKKEYVGRSFVDVDMHKRKRGRIDIAYFKNNEPYIAVEIDSGLKKSSIKKLVANNQFKYRIWFCYKKKLDLNEYNFQIERLDPNKELRYMVDKERSKETV